MCCSDCTDCFGADTLHTASRSGRGTSYMSSCYNHRFSLQQRSKALINIGQFILKMVHFNLEIINENPLLFILWRDVLVQILAAISLILIFVDLKHIPIISEIGIYAHQNIKQTVIEIRNWERLHNSRDYFSAVAFNQNRLSWSKRYLWADLNTSSTARTGLGELVQPIFCEAFCYSCFYGLFAISFL